MVQICSLPLAVTPTEPAADRQHPLRTESVHSWLLKLQFGKLSFLGEHLALGDFLCFASLGSTAGGLQLPGSPEGSGSLGEG